MIRAKPLSVSTKPSPRSGTTTPREFALPRVKSEGTLTFIVRELWNHLAWWVFSEYTNSYNIIDIYNITSNLAKPITCAVIVKQPHGSLAKDRGWTYRNCNLITIDDREIVQIGTLTMPRTMTAVYSNKLYYPATGVGGPPLASGNDHPANANQVSAANNKQFADNSA